MATPEPKIRDAIKRMPSHDNEHGLAYMRGDVLVRVLDCRKLSYPEASRIYEDLAETWRLDEYAHLSPLQLAHQFMIPLPEARILWSMIAARPMHVNCRCVLTTPEDPA